jgi:hypothetical protein
LLDGALVGCNGDADALFKPNAVRFISLTVSPPGATVKHDDYSTWSCKIQSGKKN